MTYRIPFLRPTVVALVLVVGSACADSSMPTEPRVLAGDVSAATGSGSQMTTLESLLESEKRRIERARDASKAVQDSLKDIWDELRPSNSGPGSGQGALFLICDPIQYVGQAKIIGPEGGEIQFGPHKLRVPRGALKARTVITAEAPTSLLVEAKFSPHGLQFDPRYPPTLTLSYNHCVLPQLLPTKKIVYVNDAYQILEFPASQDRNDVRLVNASIQHFSGYVVAW